MIVYTLKKTVMPTHVSLILTYLKIFAELQQRFIFVLDIDNLQCLQCFDAVGWAAGRASGL